ncbi:MAG: hypothetical protein OEY29_04265 [Gammaproteobacteria bacterium]|nr:hypothetical protein [Gammaproteobacteria bacterium]
MKIILISFLCFLAIACQSGTIKKEARPGWILNPQEGAVGSCGTHLMGRHAQEEVAIGLARTRLAAAMGVTIDQVQTVNINASNNHSNIMLDSASTQVLKNKTVKAHVRALWYDKPRDRIWAWLYPVK